MNQRIQKLAEQAFKSLETDPVYATAMIYASKELEKFAELIVQECMACATWVGRMNTTAVEPVHTAHAINQRITEHFELTKT